MSETQLRRAQAGDAEAFTALVAPFEGLVYRHCLQMLQNEADAQDAAQEAMLRAYRSIGRFLGLSSVPTWLYRIAHNVCLDMRKRPRTRAEAASLEAMGDAGFDPPDTAPTPDAAYVQQAERARLQAAMARLPRDQQLLLTLRYGENMPYDALAEALHLNEGTVKSRLNRAKARLRSLMGDG